MDLADFLEPSVLMHPNIPKPLHEVNPRNIMGKMKWDVLRQEVYASLDYHCIACGVPKTEARGHQWLEAHEFYDIDYDRGKVKIEKIIPLCHYCHNFIHAGRLYMILGKEKDENEVIAILEHGFKILAENNLEAFPSTVAIAHSLDANTFGVQPYELKGGDNIPWENWRLVWQGIEYPPKYKTYEEWSRRFNR